MAKTQSWTHISLKLLIFLALAIYLLNFIPVNADETGNRPLNQLTSYNFTSGYYNLVTLAESKTAEPWIIHQNHKKYLNLSYTAPTRGNLEVRIKPLEGSYPYIELGEGWNPDPPSYTRTMSQNETTWFLLTPPLVLSDTNTSRVVDGEVITWEIYRWPDLSGMVNFTFFSSEDVEFNLLIHPVSPRQNEKITFFTNSNAKIRNITWTLSGENLDWINKTNILEATNLKSGNYSVSVQGIDEFNTTHISHRELHVKPPVNNPSAFDLSLFSISHPESVTPGELSPLTATFDYTTPICIDVKFTLTTLETGEILKETTRILNGTGSAQFTHDLITEKEGICHFKIHVYYKTNQEWIELTPSDTSFTVTVNEPENPAKLPGYNILPISTGILLLIITRKFKDKRNN
jgi:hypothetical protein